MKGTGGEHLGSDPARGCPSNLVLRPDLSGGPLSDPMAGPVNDRDEGAMPTPIGGGGCAITEARTEASAINRFRLNPTFTGADVND